ncbi:MAG TPA: sensor histidine kinase [Actinomycetota bacterium]
MTSEGTLRWPWAISIAAILLLGVAVALTLLNDTFDLFVIVAGMMVIGYGTVGAFLATRVPSNPIGWLMIVMATSFAIVGAADEYVIYVLDTAPGALPLPEIVAWVNGFAFYGVLIPFLVILLLFPDGTLMSPRWRIVLGGILAVGGLLILSVMVSPGPLGVTDLDNPVGIEALGGVTPIVNIIGGVVLIASALATVIGVVVRYLRAPGSERRQIRPLAWIAAIALVLILVGLTLPEGSRASDLLFTAFFAVIGIGVPLAIQNAVLRHRLYDLDVVIKKTVVFAIIVVLLVAVGGVVAVLIGFGLVPRLYDTPPLFLFFGLACGLLAAPVYRLASRIADRVVYGGRARPSEVLSEFSERLSETYATDDVLPRMVTILGEATRAKDVRVWLRVGNEYRAAAAWPAEVGDSTVVIASGDVLPAFPVDAHRTEVRDRGELLGAITATFHANDPIDEGRERLIRDMAAQAGLVLRNVRLIENLRASRQRMVTAQDEGRRRLERNIHDGAQQQLVALSVKTRLADSMIDRDAAKAHEMLAQIQTDTNDALETLRDLARGIYPPLLADKGLPTALEAQARKVTIPVTLDADGIGRFPAEAEATVYFCVLEALQNIAKYADASTITVRLRSMSSALTFDVRDDGVGFDPASHTPGTGIQGMQDRLDAVGGSLQVTSALGDGTIVTGSVPITK